MELKARKRLEALARFRPDAIAEFLQVRGHRGSRGYATDCPVSNYLSKRTGKRYSVAPKGWGVFRVADDLDDDRPIEGVRVDGNIATFIKRFDRGCYPELEVGTTVVPQVSCVEADDGLVRSASTVR